MEDRKGHGFWASCEKCGWFETYFTRSDAADGQRHHDEAHARPWVLTELDVVFLKINRIASEIAE